MLSHCPRSLSCPANRHHSRKQHQSARRFSSCSLPLSLLLCRLKQEKKWNWLMSRDHRKLNLRYVVTRLHGRRPQLSSLLTQLTTRSRVGSRTPRIISILTFLASFPSFSLSIPPSPPLLPATTATPVSRVPHACCCVTLHCVVQLERGCDRVRVRRRVGRDAALQSDSSHA